MPERSTDVLGILPIVLSLLSRRLMFVVSSLPARRESSPSHFLVEDKSSCAKPRACGRIEANGCGVPQRPHFPEAPGDYILTESKRRALNMRPNLRTARENADNIHLGKIKKWNVPYFDIRPSPALHPFP